MSTIRLSLLTSPGAAAAQLVLAAALIVATVTDLRRRRIPNWLTVSGAIAGLAVHGVYGGMTDLVSSLAGLGVWFLIGFCFYTQVRGIGAGDLKLITACAALVGMIPTLYVATLSFGLQVVWMVARWVALGVVIANLKSLLRWLIAVFTFNLRATSFVPIGTADRSPHAPFLLLSAAIWSAALHFQLL
jgi:prepilin peptidase CpaA